MNKVFFAMFSIVMFWQSLDWWQEGRYLLGGFWLCLTIAYQFYEIVPSVGKAIDKWIWGNDEQ